MINDLNWNRLNKRDWYYVKKQFPDAMKEIEIWYKELYRDTDKVCVENFWFDDRGLFDFFVNLDVYICPIPSMDGGWELGIYLDSSLEFQKDFFETRAHAEEYGFIWATWHLQEKFNSIKSE